MASIDFSFITDDCKFDNGKLRQSLEDLCDIAEAPWTAVDPNAGLCGEYGTASTIFSVTIDNLLRELKVSANPAWGGASFSFIDTVTFGPPLDIDPIAFYLNGATIVVNLVNPSACRSLAVYGNFYSTDNTLEKGGGIYAHEIRDITGGAPGLLLADIQRNISVVSTRTEDTLNITPFLTTIAPGGSFTATYQAAITTSAASLGGGNSEWNQSILALQGIGVLL